MCLRRNVRRTGHSQTPRRRRAWPCQCRRACRSPQAAACGRWLKSYEGHICRAVNLVCNSLVPFVRKGFILSLRAGPCPQTSLRRRPRRFACTRRSTALPCRECLVGSLGAGPRGKSFATSRLRVMSSPGKGFGALGEPSSKSRGFTFCTLFLCVKSKANGLIVKNTLEKTGNVLVRKPGGYAC